MSDILPEQLQLFEKVARPENQGVPHLALRHHYRILFLLADDLLFSYFAIDKFY